MVYRYNVSCSKTISKIWTQSALDCYSIGCKCEKCNLYNIYFIKSSYKCMMKNTVIELVRNQGHPQMYLEGGDYIEKES